MPLTPAQRILLLAIARAGLLDRLNSQSQPVDENPAAADALDEEENSEESPDAPADAATDAEVATDAPTTDPALTTPAGCFVSLHEMATHRLRGCVGRLDPEMPLWRVVRETAADVLRDPRFTDMPVTASDIAILELEISVLSPPHLADGPLDFDPLTDGIYLIHGSRSGFFLPQVARETHWSKQRLLSRLCEEKLSLPHDTWQKPEAKLFTFKVEVIGPEAVSGEKSE